MSYTKFCIKCGVVYSSERNDGLCFYCYFDNFQVCEECGCKFDNSETGDTVCFSCLNGIDDFPF